MAKALVTLILSFFALLAISEGATSPLNQADALIQVVDDINVFRAANPDIKLIPLEVGSQTKNARQQITYAIGNRQSGDRLVSVNQDSASWPTLQDVKLTLSYPVSGVGAVVTYVEIVVQQSSNIGRGYVVAGGIGQRFIQVIIEANATSYFSYSAQIFGK
ncbi:uncharacterized protein LOC129758900 [Uranotaenia lowii]|uniref:uncharacterized protein LOC129758900 n=1 Tax=Uranotaenia lowii TaxID=190385 RepID=UPI002479FD98|nr:uncharacterized protein LOC129758900 [Uranotaenia lowii]